MTHKTEALAEDKIINLTQEVGECGATRVHQLGGDTLTIFKDNELFEFARKCAALSSQPPAPREPDNGVDAKEQLLMLARYFHRIEDLWEGPDGAPTNGTIKCLGIAATLEDLSRMPLSLGLTKLPTLAASLTATAGSTP